MRPNLKTSLMAAAVLFSFAAPAAVHAATYSIATSSCSINTDGWCLGGSNMTGFTGAITNPSNFGAGGVVPTAVTLTQLNSVTAATLAGSNAFISSWWSDGESASSVTAVVNFFLGGGDLILFQDDFFHDAIGTALGLSTLGSDGSASNGISPLFNGPFGIATDVNQFGNTGFLDAGDIAAHGGTIGGLNGAGQATSAYWGAGQYAAGAGQLVIIADVDMVSNAYVNHYSPVDSGGVFGLNSVAYIVDGGAVPEPATWGLMLLGFGGLGAVLRRQRSKTAAVAA